MSKYEPLWKWIKENKQSNFVLTYDDIEKILGFEIDHPFLTSKKELLEYGFEISKISMKERKITFTMKENKTETQINKKRLKELINYLNSDPKIEYIPYPQYDPRIFEVLNSLGHDSEYLTKYEITKDKDIKTMNLNEIKVMFTYILRGEKFCDGYIAEAIKNKTIVNLACRELELLK